MPAEQDPRLQGGFRVCAILWVCEGPHLSRGRSRGAARRGCRRPREERVHRGRGPEGTRPPPAMGPDVVCGRLDRRSWARVGRRRGRVGPRPATRRSSPPRLMANVLLDTTVAIDLLRGAPAAVAWLRESPSPIRHPVRLRRDGGRGDRRATPSRTRGCVGALRRPRTRSPGDRGRACSRLVAAALPCPRADAQPGRLPDRRVRRLDRSSARHGQSEGLPDEGSRGRARRRRSMTLNP